MTRLVLDTSVLLSGAVSAPTSPPAVLLAAARAAAFEVLACPRLFLEFERGLQKPYFRSRLDSAEAAELLDALQLLSITLPDPPMLRRVLRDPADDYLLELAQAGGAEAIVSGDADLLDHDGLRPPAIHARAACELLGVLQPRSDVRALADSMGSSRARQFDCAGARSISSTPVTV